MALHSQLPIYKVAYDLLCNVTANSYFGLLRQASHSHADRARLANVVRRRGKVVDGRLTRAFA